MSESWYPSKRQRVAHDGHLQRGYNHQPAYGSAYYDQGGYNHQEAHNHQEIFTAGSIDTYQADIEAQYLAQCVSTQPQGHGRESLVTDAPNSELEEVVCFGMITNLTASIKATPGLALSLPRNVRLSDPLNFEAVDGPPMQGTLKTDLTHITEALLEDKDLELEVLCTDDPSRAAPASSYSRVYPCIMSITIHGPTGAFEEVGTYFQEEGIYLQNPVHTEKHYRYLNPHRLSSVCTDTIVWTTDVKNIQNGLLDLKERRVESTMLDIFESNEELAETPQPRGIRTLLERHGGETPESQSAMKANLFARHQKQALTFMLRRERGWGFMMETPVPDVWDIKETHDGVYFINMISGLQQVAQPPDFFGGVIADPMGFGKTLAMISLVATDIDAENLFPGSPTSSKLTLVVVPAPMLGTWKAEVFNYTMQTAIPLMRYYGSWRTIDHHLMSSHGIVLTTYHTVAAEWKSMGKTMNSSPLFDIQWRRIVLDEAHNIKNVQTQMARTLGKLQGRSRWAVTGTPTQNHLKDFSALLSFLQVHPYSDQKLFDRDISSLWKDHKEEEAKRRLIRLSRHLLLRRPQRTVILPPRKDLLCPVEFTPKERAFYDEIRDGVIAHLDESMREAADRTGGRSYLNALHRIEAMKMVCDLGVYYEYRHQTSKALLDRTDWSQIAQTSFLRCCEMGPMQCHYCNADVQPSDFEGQDTGNAHFAQCLQCICSSCAASAMMHGESARCGHHMPCPIAQVSLEPPMDDDFPLAKGVNAHQPIVLSTKVATLVSQIQDLPQGTKSVVFSNWRMSLDMVEAGLRRASISVLRFDGKVPQAERQTVVNRFQNPEDSSVQVLLLTLSCGAVGLTLTAASYAYLLEPHWNPTVEEQALARIHRMGQKRPVTTVRLYVRDTFEERVMQVQDSKKALADLVLGAHNEQDGNKSLKNLERLRSLV